jgi:hypothetical protein
MVRIKARARHGDDQMMPETRPAFSWRAASALLEPVSLGGSLKLTGVGFGVVLCWVSIGFSLSTEVTMDDSFIVFRVVENWLAGLGPRFNVDDVHFIVTSPLWLVMLAACKAALPSVATPDLAQVLVWGLLVVASLLLFGLLIDAFPIASMLAPAAIFYTPSMGSLAGHDTACALAAGLALLVCHQRDHPNGLAIAAGLFYLARGEGAVLAAIVGCHYLLRAGLDWTSVRGQVRRMLPGLGVAVACVGGWHLYFAMEFRELFPSTLAIKIAQGSLQGNALSDPIWPAFADGLPDHFALIATGAAQPLLMAGFAVLALRRWALAVWPLAHVAIYAGLGVPYYHWYYYPVELVGVISVLVGAEIVLRLVLAFLPGGAGLRASAVVLTLLVGIVAVPSIRGPMWLQQAPMLPALRSVTSPEAPEIDARFRVYREIAAWTAAQPGSENRALLASEIGILGHALPSLRVLDVVGLTEPGIPPERFFDYRWHIERYEPDYLLLFLGAAQLEEHAISLSDGRVFRYRRAFLPQGQFRGAALFERDGPSS